MCKDASNETEDVVLARLDRIQESINKLSVQISRCTKPFAAEPFTGTPALTAFLTERIPTFASKNTASHVEYLFKFLRALDRDSVKKLKPTLQNLNFLDSPLSEKHLEIENTFQQFQLEPCVCIMASILAEIPDLELSATFELAMVRAKISEQAYRCKIIVNCLSWFISDLFRPSENVEATLTGLGRNPYTQDGLNFKHTVESLALKWAIEGSNLSDIIRGEEEPGEQESKHINTMWQFLITCKKPLVKFIFKFAQFGIEAPADLWTINDSKLLQRMVQSWCVVAERE